MENYMLVGKRLGHSFSAKYFNQRFASEGRDALYSLCEIDDISELKEKISEMPGLIGFNVTIPYKEDILPLLHRISPLAAQVGAVNTVKVIGDSSGEYLLEGYNTDVEGFVISIKEMIEANSKLYGAYTHGSKALVLGSGGASKAVTTGLLQLGFKPIVVSRREGAADTTYRKLNPQNVWDAEIIVNATPAGMYPNTLGTPPFPYEYMRAPGVRPQIAFDLVYNPEETLFMKICRSHGAMTQNGLGMLYTQAEAAWRIWSANPGISAD